MPKIPLIIIGGATASGKTALSKKLFHSEQHPELYDRAEIISADSAQVYRGMRIGTAAPTLDVQTQLAHHLLQIISPFQEFSVADFVKQADFWIQDIFSRNKMPVVVGGTAFFIKHLLYGLPSTPPSNPEIRSHFQKRAEIEGSPALLAELRGVDPARAAQIHPNDAYRIIRALEVYTETGKALANFETPSQLRSCYQPFVIRLEVPRPLLYQRITARAQIMINQGLIEEFRQLYESGCRAHTPGMKAIGYKEFFELNPTKATAADPNAVCQKIIQNTKRYAKRQETFFKKIPANAILIYEDENSQQDLYETLRNFFADFNLGKYE